MSRFTRRLLTATVLGYCALAAADAISLGVRVLRHELEHQALVDEPIAAGDLHRDLDDAAGTFHRYIGTDPLCCALCLCTETHPIHRVGPGA